MTSEAAFLQKAEIIEFPRLMMNRKTGTIILARRMDDCGYYGTCVHDPTGISKLGDEARWMLSEFTTFKGDVVLHG